MFAVRVVGVAEVVEDGDCLGNSLDGGLTQGGNSRRDDGSAADQMLA